MRVLVCTLLLLLSLPSSHCLAAEWRLRVREAAVVHTDTVKLGDIADPVGAISPEEWKHLSAQVLWPSPQEVGKPMRINKQRLAQALTESLGTAADYFLLPSTLVLQKGGSVLLEGDLRTLVLQSLSPQLNLLGGRFDLSDFRLPAYAFLSSTSQKVVLEDKNPVPGRMTLRFAVQELDGAVIRRFTGNMFLNLWMDVPCAARSLSRGDALGPSDIVFISKNVAQVRGEPWDGKGGPWQVTRAINPEQILLISDLSPQAMIRKGNKVSLVYNKGSVQITTMVEALEDGGPGATIAVRNLDSKQQVYAVVRDANTVTTK